MKHFVEIAAVCAALVMPYTAFSAHHGDKKMDLPLANQLLVESVDAAAQKVLQLAVAIPESQWGYKPMEGVSDVKDVVVHLASANFGLAGMLGMAPPDGITPSDLDDTVSSKEEAIKLYQQSVQHVQKVLADISPEDMAEEIQFFGMNAPRGRLAGIVADHQHEHLGQLIAYARANMVVPPWSQ